METQVMIMITNDDDDGMMIRTMMREPCPLTTTVRLTVSTVEQVEVEVSWCSYLLVITYSDNVL